MTDDRPYIEANKQQRDRLRALVERLDDKTLAKPVNEYWTVAGVLGHMAYWDVRFMVLAEKIDQGQFTRAEALSVAQGILFESPQSLIGMSPRKM